MITCFSAFLLCFCDGEMTLPAGMVGDGQADWGEDGCDLSLIHISEPTRH